MIPSSCLYARIQNTTHLFDGKSVYPKGRTFQFIDMVDPILVQIKEGATKRHEAHVCCSSFIFLVLTSPAKRWMVAVSDHAGYQSHHQS